MGKKGKKYKITDKIDDDKKNYFVSYKKFQRLNIYKFKDSPKKFNKLILKIKNMVILIKENSQAYGIDMSKNAFLLSLTSDIGFKVAQNLKQKVGIYMVLIVYLIENF